MNKGNTIPVNEDPVPLDPNSEDAESSNEDLDEPLDEYDIDPDPRDALEEADQNPFPDYVVPSRPSSAPVTDLPMPVTISDIIATQNSDDFC